MKGKENFIPNDIQREIKLLEEMIAEMRKQWDYISPRFREIALDDLKKYRGRLEVVLSTVVVDMTAPELAEVQDLNMILRSSVESLPLPTEKNRRRKILRSFGTLNIRLIGHVVHLEEASQRIKVGIFQKFRREKERAKGSRNALATLQATEYEEEVDLYSLESIGGIGQDFEALILETLGKLIPLERELSDDEIEAFKRFEAEQGKFIVNR